jgi:hypothetical protein
MDEMTRLAIIVVVVAVGGVFLYGWLMTDILDVMYEDHYGEPPPRTHDDPGCAQISPTVPGTQQQGSERRNQPLMMASAQPTPGWT